MSDTENSGSAFNKDEVVTELKDFFTSKFSELKRDFREETEWNNERVRKKVRSDNSLAFNSAGNKKQYNFNTEIIDILDATKRAIELRSASKGIDFIQEAQDKLKHRNKIIRIADNSSLGWTVVAEYEKNDVASDSDDDKKIGRAEDRARSKVERAKRARESSNQTDNSVSTFQITDIFP